ncbi:MAG: hypothetical protein AB7F64_06515 [Gammaproteobacteria bacterium]
MTEYIEFKYKHCDIRYEIYGEAGQFGASAEIVYPTPAEEICVHPITLESSHPSYQNADHAIQEKAKHWVDKNL